MIYVTPMPAVPHVYPASQYDPEAFAPSYYPNHTRYPWDYSEAVAADIAVTHAARAYAQAKARAEALHRQRVNQAQLYELQRRRQHVEGLRQATFFAHLADVAERHAQPFGDALRSNYSNSSFAAGASRCACNEDVFVSQRRREARIARMKQASEQHKQQRSTPLVSQNTTQAEKTEDVELKASLGSRLHADQDQEIQELIESLLSRIFGVSPTKDEKPTESKGKARETPAVPFPWKQPSAGEQQKKAVHFDEAVTLQDGAELHLAPAILLSEAESKELIERRQQRQLALNAIDRIRIMLGRLRRSFVFPETLDFATRSPSPTLDSDSESSSLPFTHRNKPVLAYEHALNGLLVQLDGVESNGDEEVRQKRKEVVIEVEQALGDIEQLVTAASSPRQEKVELADVSLNESDPAIQDRAADAQQIDDVHKTHSDWVPIIMHTVSTSQVVDRDISDALTSPPSDVASSDRIDLSAPDVTTYPFEVDNHTIELEAEPVEAEAEFVMTAVGTEADYVEDVADPQAEPDELSLDDAEHSSVPITSIQNWPSGMKFENTSSTNAEPYLLRSSPLEDDRSHVKAKARALVDDDTEWQEDVVDEESWSEVE